MSTGALVWLDERAAADVAAVQAPRPFFGRIGVCTIRRLVEVIDDCCDGVACLCSCEPEQWQRGCPVSDLPAAPPWRPDREPAR
jgi:hypothetical protein